MPHIRRTRRTRPWRHAILILTAVAGTFASVGMFLTIRTWQARMTELRFISLASDHLQTINAGLKDASELLYALRAYFESCEQPPVRSEYLAFSSSLRERVAGLRAAGWAPHITAAERDAFEREVQASGLPDFQITERDAGGRLVRAQERPEYFPVLYADPAAANLDLLGFDLASETLRRGAIVRARATDRPAATPLLRLAGEPLPGGGVLSFVPVKSREDVATEGARSVAGMIFGTFESAAMIRRLLGASLYLRDLDVYVFDPNGAAGSRLISWHAAAGGPPPREALLLAGLHWQGTLQLVDQRWGAIFVPAKAFVGPDTGWTPVAVLAAGMIMTMSIVLYLWFSLRRTQQLETLTGSLRDTTAELRRKGARLDHMARHDALTGLPNRVVFREEVASGLRRVRRGQDLAVLYLDLDRFKTVNDTLGHPIGDLLLCEVAERLRQTVREIDAITRLGGDEFAIAQSGPGQPRSAETLAHRLIETLGRPYDINGHHVVVGASIGITVAGPDDEDADQLLRRADMALYAAKRDGRGVVRCFEPAMDLEAQARRGLEMDLRHALETGGLDIYCQPQVGIADGQVRGFEALLRWQHPQRGVVLPSDFMQCAEETGLIGPIGDWVLRTALAHATQWPSDVRLSVNLSPLQLAHDDLADTVEAALAATGQAGSRLELEITETALLEHHAPGQATLRRLRDLGVRIAMDDSGTGYASLSHLRSFPFDRLKIDQSFVARMTESPEGRAVVTAILQLATSLGIATTAEGVETRRQLEQLAASGCTEAQGFLFSAPQPAGEIPRLLAGWHIVAAPAFARQEGVG
ncbi:MAG: putative bifunctional diguanylate cyclase/phosphodiesterase [Rhodopila sp.]